MTIEDFATEAEFISETEALDLADQGERLEVLNSLYRANDAIIKAIDRVINPVQLRMEV